MDRYDEKKDASDERRERLREDDETLNPRREDPYKQSPGATGIDMGAGGRGTDVSGE